MSKKVAIVQSNYIPWKGYFDLINSVDEFILFDDMQYTKRNWRNRNRIKTANGLAWLTVPIKVTGRYHQRISESVVSDPRWMIGHWKTIRHCYARARYFAAYRDFLEELYLGTTQEHLSDINYRFIRAICSLLGIGTKLSWSSNYELVEGKTERLVQLCKLAGATDYVSGPGARVYLDVELFNKAGINVRYMNYDGYPAYRQLFPPFEHAVSIIDLVLNEGSNAVKYMLSFA